MLEPIKWWRLTPSWWLEAAAEETAEAAFIRLTGTNPLDRPCPHCQYFGGEEHHPTCVVVEKRRLLASIHTIRGGRQV